MHLKCASLWTRKSFVNVCVFLFVFLVCVFCIFAFVCASAIVLAKDGRLSLYWDAKIRNLSFSFLLNYNYYVHRNV
jgi:hypothetical protein